MAVPSVTTLDNFARANSTNSLGANWANSAFYNETSFFNVTSNLVARAAGGLNANYWTQQQFGGPNNRVEVGITFDTGFNTAAGGRHGVLASVTNPGAQVNAYEYYADQFGKLNLDIWKDGVATSLKSSIVPSFGVLTNNDAILLVVDIAGIEGWAYRATNGWIKVLTATDISLTNILGYVGIRGQFGTATRISNFIAGSLVKQPQLSLLRAGTSGGTSAISPVAMSSLATKTASSGQGFLDSMAVNGHWNYYSGTNGSGDVYAYGNPSLQNYRDKIQSLGIQHVRDGEPYSATGQAHYTDLNSKNIKVLATAPGAYGKTGALDYPNNLNTWFAQLKPFAYMIQAFEGTNEYDLFGTTDPDPTASLLEQQKRLYTMVKSDPATSHIPVIAPSIGHPNNAQAYADRDALDNPNDRIWNYFDYACWHNYSGTNFPGPSFLSEIRTALDPFYGTQTSVIVTESGFNQTTYYNVCMNAQAAGDALVKLYCEHYLHGIERSYLYEIVDQNIDRLGGSDTNTHWGQFYTYNWSDKPGATYTRNLRTLLSGVSSNNPILKYAFNNDSNLGSLLLGMNDGSFRFLVWQRQLSWNFTTKTYATPSDVSATLMFDTNKSVHERKTNDINYNANLGTNTTFSLTISGPNVHIFEIT